MNLKNKYLLITFVFTTLLFQGCFLKKDSSPDCAVKPPDGYSCKSTEGQTFSPVCGCDSNTYYNACRAGYSVRVAKYRPCNTSYKNDTVTYLGNYQFLLQNKYTLTFEIKNYIYDEYSQWGIFRNRERNYIGKKFILSYLVMGRGTVSSGSIYHNGATIIGADCTDAFEPVCGSDSLTYINACYADYLKKTYTSGACPSSIVTDSLKFVGNYKFETSNRQAITITKPHNWRDRQGQYAYYNNNTSAIGTTSPITYINAKDDYFEYHYFK